MNKLIEIIRQKEELQKKFRNVLLLSLMKASVAYPHSFIDFFKVANRVGLDKESAKEMFDYFKSEGFFNRTTRTGFVDISTKAIREAEKCLDNSQQSTVQSPIVIQNFSNPNTLWIKEHHTEYAGKYIALENGKLVGQGRNFPETLADAKKNGAEKPFITYVFPPNSEPFGGW